MLGEEESSPEIKVQQQDRERVVRLKRSLVSGWKGEEQGGEPRTPIPSWKLYENPFYEGLAAAVAAATEAAAKAAAGGMQGKRKDGGGALAGRGAVPKNVEAGGVAMVGTGAGAAGGNGAGGSSSSSNSVSARKLAASLWEELQEIPVSARAPPPPAAFLLRRFPPPPALHPSDTSPCSHLQSRPSSRSASDSPNIDPSKPSTFPRKHRYSPAAFVVDPPMKTIAILRPNTSEESVPRRKSVSRSRATYASPLGMDVRKEATTLADNGHLGDAGPPTSPRDYVKSIDRSRPSVEQQNSNSPEVLALRSELQLARAHIHELEAALKSAGKDMESLLKRCSDERMLLRTREQERIELAICAIGEELEIERKARKKLEVQNKKLSKNLSDTNKKAIKAMEDLDDERKARRLMEDVCDELARKIGEDNAEVEELKRGHAKAKEEIEEERRMLQMAEVWREERVQMKFSAARLELEKNSMSVSNMRDVVEKFLSAQRTSSIGYDFQQQIEDQAESLQQALETLQAQTVVSMRVIGESVNQPSGSDDTCSSEELHSLHLPRMESVRPQDCNLHQHFDPRDHVWANRRHPSRRSRRASLKSYTSRPHELDRVCSKDKDFDRFQRQAYGLEFETDEELSTVECASNRCEERGEESNWSADYDDDDENMRNDGSSWQRGSDEDEKMCKSSLKFRNKVYSLPDTPVKGKDGRGGGPIEQTYGAPRIVCTANAVGEGDSYRNSDVFYVEDSESLAGFSPKQQLPLNGAGNPAFRAWKGNLSLTEAATRTPTQGRYSVDGCSMVWPKPFRNKSLHAMLLEDIMNSPQFQPRHARRKPKRR